MDKMATKQANKHLLKPARLDLLVQGYNFTKIENILGDFGGGWLIPVFWDKESGMWAGMDNGVFVSFKAEELHGWLPIPSASCPLVDMSASVAEAMLDNGLRVIYRRVLDEVDTGVGKVVIVRAEGNRTTAAQLLGVSTATVRKWIATLNLAELCRGYTRKCATEGGK